MEFSGVEWFFFAMLAAAALLLALAAGQRLWRVRRLERPARTRARRTSLVPLSGASVASALLIGWAAIGEQPQGYGNLLLLDAYFLAGFVLLSLGSAFLLLSVQRSTVPLPPSPSHRPGAL